MDKFFLALFTMLLPSPAWAEEAVVLADGSTIYGYYSEMVPARFKRTDCDIYGFRNPSYVSLKNGLYSGQNKQQFLIENNCLFPFMGAATLHNGRAIYFFQDSVFDGNLAYFYQNKTYAKVPDGKYALKNGQTFATRSGRIEDLGLFENGQIIFSETD